MTFNQAKVFEAREHIKSAEKWLKTGMFRWKPDYDAAADEYSQAAQCYRIARDMENSKALHIKASEYYKKCNSLFNAAKSIEQAILVSKESATPDELYDLAVESSCLYQQHGSGDAAASILDKTGKLLERRNGDLASKLFVQATDASAMGNGSSKTRLLELAKYLYDHLELGNIMKEDVKILNCITNVANFIRGTDKSSEQLKEFYGNLRDINILIDYAADVLFKTIPGPAEPVAHGHGQSAQPAQPARPAQTESGQHQGSEYIAKASRILVRLQRYDEALDCLRREIGFHQESGNTGAIGRLTVAIVLVQLARGDTVAAEKAYKEWGSNCEVAEMQTLEQILQAYDEEDREAAKRALASPFIRNMDVEYARLAATVPLPEALEPAPRAAVRENAAPSYVSPNAQSTTTAEISHEVEESPYAPVTYTKKSDEEDGLC